MTKSVYPPPPPTRNDLTPHQRSQLLRSTRKLSKILGTTPRLVDAHVPADPILLDLPLSPGAFEDAASFRLSSESLSSLPSTQHAAGFTTSVQPHYNSTAPPDIAPSGSVNSSSSSVDDPYLLEELWPALKQPPLHISLRPKASLSRSRSSSVTSHRDSDSRSRHNRSPSLDGFCSQSDSDTDDETHLIPYFTYSALSPSKARDTILTSPSTSSTLDNSLRRQKMERVTRTLGERVPWKLVFPPENEPWWKGRGDTPAGTRKRASSFNIPRVPVPILESDEETTDEENVVTVGITIKPTTNERGRKVLSMILE
ncbi:hypothetical protein DL96DRAFT_1717061 [Flagelloscypha sp. PMI_526]|nr:hypothetical protein DL96DRAFT_1717061 [Flagelloscypha sp. PMI_526]